MDKKIKGANVAFDKQLLQAWAFGAGWKDISIYPGSWSGRSGPTTDFQDIIVFQ